jgi:ketosteroid isomerase-like protein
MLNTPEEIITKFYTAFSNRDYTAMQNCYHPDATFSDAAFQNLNSKEVKAMWQMLISSSTDIKVIFSEVKGKADHGSCRWDAYYSFTQTNRKVHNIVYAQFKFKDGLIIEHRDHFDFWRWSRMALGTSGLLLGWSPMLKNKVQQSARAKLEKFMSRQFPG